MLEQVENPDNLLFMPPPSVPQAFWDEFNKIVPLCDNGVDRQLRVVWGCKRREYVAGQWSIRYADLDNEPAKYIGRCRWIFEVWAPPDIYDEAEWKQNEHLLGEWPSKGVWDWASYHVTGDGGYLPLDESALTVARNWAYWRDQGPKRSIEHLMEKRMLRWSLQQQRREAAAKVVSTRFGEAAVKIMENNTNPVSTSGRNISAGYKQTEGGILIKE